MRATSPTSAIGSRIRFWSILLLGLLFSKVVCLLVGVVIGRPNEAWKAVKTAWIFGEPLLNLWELPPFFFDGGGD